MKIKYIGKNEELKLIKNKIIENDIEFVYENEDYILKKTNHEIETIVGKKNQSYHILHHKDIIYIESLDNLVIAHTMTNEYHIKETDTLFVTTNEAHGYTNTGKEDLQFLCIIPILK